MYSPVSPNPQNPPGMLDQGSQVEQNCCWKVSCWIFQILTWISLIVSIFLVLRGSEASIFGSFGACYFIYIILEFCSPTSRYLCNKSSIKAQIWECTKKWEEILEPLQKFASIVSATIMKQFSIQELIKMEE